MLSADGLPDDVNRRHNTRPSKDEVRPWDRRRRIDQWQEDCPAEGWRLTAAQSVAVVEGCGPALAAETGETSYVLHKIRYGLCIDLRHV